MSIARLWSRAISRRRCSPFADHASQTRVVKASLALIKERTRLKATQVRSRGGSIATTSLIGVPLGHNSSVLQGPAFAPPKIRQALWCISTNSTTAEGKLLHDARVLINAGDLPVEELRTCGVNEALMQTVTDAVKLVMGEHPLRQLILSGDHSISFPVIRAVVEMLGGRVDVLHLHGHPDRYDEFEGKPFPRSRASWRATLGTKGSSKSRKRLAARRHRLPARPRQPSTGPASGSPRHQLPLGCGS